MNPVAQKKGRKMTCHSKPEDIMADMLNTFRERGEKYGNNYIEIGDVLKSMFPNGLTLESPEDHRLYHIFLLIVVKMTRLANSNLRHIDSFRDIGVYAAMGESLVAGGCGGCGCDPDVTCLFTDPTCGANE